MYALDFTKPDGRQLTLYSQRPIDSRISAPSPFAEPLNASPHLRWHPLRGEWVTYAAYRQGRTFLPPPEFNPLGVTVDPAHPTEVPDGDWDVAVFDNRFPSLEPVKRTASFVDRPDRLRGRHLRGGGFYKGCACLARCSAARPHRLTAASVGATALAGLLERSEIAYVLPFENRGAEVGVTLHHPHGQIYAYPVVPPVPARMQQEAQLYYQRKGRGVLQDLIEAERAERTRMIYEGPHVVAFVPVCARYPYEVWVAPIDPVENFVQLDSRLAR